MKRKNLYLTEPQIKSLKLESKRTGKSVAELVRRAIDNFLQFDR